MQLREVSKENSVIGLLLLNKVCFIGLLRKVIHSFRGK